MHTGTRLENACADFQAEKQHVDHDQKDCQARLKQGSPNNVIKYTLSIKALILLAMQREKPVPPFSQEGTGLMP